MHISEGLKYISGILNYQNSNQVTGNESKAFPSV